VNTSANVNAVNGAFSGDVNIVGALTTGTGPIANGVYDSDWRLAANHSFYSTAGSGKIDFSNATGIWKMPTGAGTIGGTTDFNGAITARNITLDANYNIVTSGTGTITSAAAITGEQITSTDDITVYDKATVDELYVNETSDFLQEAEFSVAIDMTSYETAVDTGISDSNIPGLYFVGNASANQTLTLPAAASADGCSLVFVVKANVGSYNVVIDGDDAETINGAATKTNSDQYSMPEVTSDGTAWYITDSIGTWT
jgi:hypothetical protein